MQSYEFYFYQQNILVKNYHFTNKKERNHRTPSDNPAPQIIWQIIFCGWGRR